MQDADIERPTNAPSATPERMIDPANPQQKATESQSRKRHPWPLILGLTGLLGAVWAVAIASRYPNILPG